MLQNKVEGSKQDWLSFMWALETEQHVMRKSMLESVLYRFGRYVKTNYPSHPKHKVKERQRQSLAPALP